MALLQSFLELEQALLASLQHLYGPRLVSVVIYGSVGRGTPRFDSDVDCLLVVRDLPSRMKRMLEFEAIEAELAPVLAHLAQGGITSDMSPVFKTPEEASAGSPLFLDMLEDGRLLQDEGGFFAGVLERLRARLKALGSRRVRLGNAWYWELKPDLQPGEVFEL